MARIFLWKLSTRLMRVSIFLSLGSQCFWYYDGLKQYRLTGGHARFWTTVISWFGKNYHKTHLYENLKGEFSYDSLEPPKQK